MIMIKFKNLNQKFLDLLNNDPPFAYTGYGGWLINEVGPYTYDDLKGA